MIQDYVALDLETTGLSPQKNKIIEIGAVKVRAGKETEKFSMLVDPEERLSPIITQVTGINDDMLEGCEVISTVLPQFLEFCGDDVIIGHNLQFDYSFLSVSAAKNNLTFEKKGIDTLKIAKKFLAHLESRKLDELCRYYEIEDDNHHRAFNDALVASRLYQKMLTLFDTSDKVFEPAQMEYKVKKISPITQKQKVYLIDLIKYHRIDFKPNIDSMTKSEASRWIDKIILTHGRIR